MFFLQNKNTKNKNILEVPRNHNLLHIFTVNLITSDPTVQTQLQSGWKGGTLGSVRWVVVVHSLKFGVWFFELAVPVTLWGHSGKWGGDICSVGFLGDACLPKLEIYIEISEWGFSKIKCSLSHFYPSRMSMCFDILGEQGLTVSEIILFQW